MIEKADVCLFKPPMLTEQEAMNKLSIDIPGYPVEIFKYIEFEDIEKYKYFITSYGRLFINYGRELFPEEYIPPKQNNVYLRIELSCSTYQKRRRFFVHRLVANAFVPKLPIDIEMHRDLVNHKYNKDGRCNYAWNLEWVNDSENTLHGLYFNEKFNEELFDHNIILNRRSLIHYNQDGDLNPKSRISEHQANLICYAYTVLHYSIADCAKYAWLDGDEKDLLVVRSIINGHSWTSVSIKYGIIPKDKIKRKRTTSFRPERKDEYDKIRSTKRR